MRNINMDVLRGIAVLGLMFMNAYFFGVFEYGYVPSPQPPLSDNIIHTAALIFTLLPVIWRRLSYSTAASSVT